MAHTSQNSKDGEDYQKKLLLANGEQLPDPYGLPASEWSSNLKLWPDLEFPQIHMYLINTPSVYTNENKGAYKSLDAYNYVMCGHVQTIKYHPIDKSNEYCFVMSEVLPSQRQGERSQMYKAWVCLHKKTAAILTAHCTCMAGCGSVCSHAAAVMIKVEMAVRNGFTQSEACTSKASAWNDMSRKKVTPAPLSEINLRKPKVNLQKKRKRDTSQVNSQAKPFKAITEEDILELRDIYPKAAVLTSCDHENSDTTDTDTASESDEILPQPMTSLYDPAAKSLTEEELGTKCCRIFNNLPKIFSPEQLNTLETVTREQRNCTAWYAHRNGRITASNVGEVCSTTDVNLVYSLNETLMGYADKYDNKAMQWGREHEDMAKKEYVKDESPKHTELKVQDSGFVVPHSNAYIGASPDGIISCKCCGKGVLEVKCPYRYREKIVNYENDSSFILDANGEPKKSHDWYHQIQTQMYACDLPYSDLAIWSIGGLVTNRIYKDDTFIEEILPKLESYFLKNLLPEVVTRKNDPLNVTPTTCYVCSKPKFGKVIFCSVQTCHKMYHYACINMKRMKRSWVCPFCL